MSERKKYQGNYPIHYRMGYESGKAIASLLSRGNLKDLFDNAETEQDLLTSLGETWNRVEANMVEMFKAISLDFEGYPFEAAREGWADGFIDFVFPYRHLA